MKGEKKIGRAQKQARTTRSFRPKQKHRKTPQHKLLEIGSKNKLTEQSMQRGWNKSKSKRIKTD